MEQKMMQRQSKKIQIMKSNIGKFFKENTISDLMPYNQKVVVLNNECTICQAIEAMVYH